MSATEKTWTARCDCYKGHNSSSGRCNSRNVQGTKLASGAVVCDDCRRDCKPKTTAKETR